MNGRMKNESVGGFELIIYLPLSYQQGDRRFPVVYVQDAGEVVAGGWNYVEHLMITKQLPEIIFVGIKPHNRNTEYTPWPAQSLIPDGPGFGGGASEYLKTLVYQIKPFVDSAYLTHPEVRYTGIAGCSFGGLVSLFAYYQYPEVFGKYALISASFWYEGFMDYLRRESIKIADHRLYMYVGELEGKYKSNIQRGMVEQTKEAHTLLLKQGFLQSQLKFEIDDHGTHDDFFFTQRFMNAMLWLFREGECEDE